MLVTRLTFSLTDIQRERVDIYTTAKNNDSCYWIFRTDFGGTLVK